MDGEVIKSFLVGLGFGVDDASLAKFNKAIASAAVRVTALYTSIQVAAAGIFASISHMSEGFEEVGYQLRLVAPAINKFLILRQAMISAYAAAGINLTHAVQQSILFNYSLAKTKFALEAVYKSVGVKFLPLLTKQMDIFRSKIFANMPKIQESLTKFVTFIFKAFTATAELGERVWSILGRVWDFFVKLDESTNGWSTKILLAVAAWKLLNLEFLATPLGMILTGLFAILALYDDFKVWQEGGKSFFDWTDAIPVINAVGGAISAVMSSTWGIIKNFADIWRSLVDTILDVVLAIQQFAAGVPGAFGSLADAAKSVLGIFKSMGAVIGDIDQGIAGFVSSLSKINVGGILSGISSGISSTLGSIQSLPLLSGIMHPQPLTPSNSGGNMQKVNQETNINIQGSGDASSVGKAVASEQSKVNFDMTRNLKGAIR